MNIGDVVVSLRHPFTEKKVLLWIQREAMESLVHVK